MVLWNLIEMLSLHYCISCVATSNQTTKEITPNIWESKHISTPIRKGKRKKGQQNKQKTKILQNILKNHDSIWMLNLAKKSSANFWLTLTFFILVRKPCMPKKINIAWLVLICWKKFIEFEAFWWLFWESDQKYWCRHWMDQLFKETSFWEKKDQFINTNIKF